MKITAETLIVEIELADVERAATSPVRRDFEVAQLAAVERATRVETYDRHTFRVFAAFDAPGRLYEGLAPQVNGIPAAIDPRLRKSGLARLLETLRADVADEEPHP